MATASGDVYWNTGDFIRATESYSRALSLAKQIKSKEDIVNTLEDWRMLRLTQAN